MNMGITFKVRASDLNNAIEIASIVPPRPFDKQGSAGYLFVIRGDRGYVYSRDAQHVARADFPLEEVEGEGAFIYPATGVDSFNSFSEDIITFEVKTDSDAYSVKYSTTSGAWEERPSFTPEFIESCDRELEEAKADQTFSVQILREALSQSRNFTETKDAHVDDKQKTIQIFDKDVEVDDPKNPGQKIRPCEKGDGTLFASNGIQAFYFYSDAFQNRHLAVHSTHLPLLQAFLAKASGDISLKTGGNKTYVIDAAGRVFGWTHSNSVHQKYTYYALSNDTHVTLIDRDGMVKALKHVRKLLDDKREKVRLVFDVKGEGSATMQFQVMEGTGRGQSWPVPVHITDETKECKSFQVSVNVRHFIELFDGCKSNKVTLRTSFLPANEKRQKDQGMFRTIDEFVLDKAGKVVGGSGVEKLPEGASVCKVTRFAPSMI
jgi:hypothetical protein